MVPFILKNYEGSVGWAVCVRVGWCVCVLHKLSSCSACSAWPTVQQRSGWNVGQTAPSYSFLFSLIQSRFLLSLWIFFLFFFANQEESLRFV